MVRARDRRGEGRPHVRHGAIRSAGGPAPDAAQWTIIDLAVAVAIGRGAVAQAQSCATGAVALLTIVKAHRLASVPRVKPVLGKLTDYRVRVLLADDQIRRGQLRHCGLTDNDLYAELRQRGVFDVSHVQYVLYEDKRGLTVVPRGIASPTPLISEGLRRSVGYAPSEGIAAAPPRR